MALSAGVIASFFPAILGGFVWDDVIITGSEAVREPSGLATIWFSPGAIEGEGHYWPVTYTSFWLEHKLWGFSPVGFHIVSVLLHLANSLLVWRLMVRLAVPGAWLVAAVFAVHPVHVESVAWVIERKGLLAGLFYLTAALIWMRQTEEPTRGRHALALGLFAAALLSKSSAVTFPAALLIWYAWKHGRPNADHLWRHASFFVVALGITVADLAFYWGREAYSFNYSLVERTLIAARALGSYVGTLVWPASLPVIYPRWDVTTTDLFAWGCLLAITASLALLWICRRRIGAGPFVGAVFFAVTLSPVLGFLNFGYMQFSFVADRYQYLACIGLIAPVIGFAVHGIERRGGTSVLWGRGLAALVLVSLGWLSWQQSGIYRDGIELFRHIVALNPEALRAHHNLSVALGNAERYEESVAAGLVAIKQAPNYPGAHANLGRVLAMDDRPDEAEPHFLRALELDPDNGTALYHLAESRRKQGRFDESIEHYRSLLEALPDHLLGHVGIGNSLIELGRDDEAIEAMSAALLLQPGLQDEASLHRFMGRASENLGRLDEAAEHLMRATEVAPDDPALLMDLHRVRNLQGRHEEAAEFLRQARDLQGGGTGISIEEADALRLQGQLEEALDSYSSLVEIDPDHVEAHVGRGNALFDLGRFEEAVEAMAQAVAIRPSLDQDSSVQRFMGRALQKASRFEEAMGHFRTALAIDPNDALSIGPLAAMLFERRQYTDARQLYRKLNEIRPQDAQAAANLAVTEYYMGRTDEAIRGFERALSLDPTLKTALDGLAAARAAVPK